MYCCCSVAKSCLALSTSWTAAHQASLSFTISQSLLKLMFIESVMPSNQIILLLLTSMSQHQGLFPVSWLFALGGQNIAASTSASVLPMNIQGWFPLGLTGLISLLSKGFSRVFSSTTVQKHQFFSSLPTLITIKTHNYMPAAWNYYYSYSIDEETEVQSG